MRFISSASLALLLTSTVAQAVPTPVNVLGENGSSATLSLQGIINARGNTLVNIASDADQLDDGIGGDAWWTAGSGISSALVIEVAGYAPDNRFGIYNVANPGQKIQVFGGSATGGASAVTISPFETFGFYLTNSVAGFTWYSDTSLNPGGLDHMVAYQGKGETLNLGNNAGSPTGSILWGTNTYVLGWEDLSLGDNDYNDMVVAVSNVQPVSVPDGVSTLALVGLVIGLVAPLRRFLR
jgi:hypothetical protein